MPSHLSQTFPFVKTIGQETYASFALMAEAGTVIERVRLIARQLQDRKPRPKKQMVAKQLGISPSMLSKILNEDGPKANLRDDVIASILDTLELRADFLFEPDLGPDPNFELWKRRKVEAPAQPPFWAEFTKRWHRFAELRADERAALHDMLTVRASIRDWTDWVPLAEWLIAHRRAK